MNILLWHLHGSWTTSFVQGKHRYLVPVTPDRGPYGLGRARTYQWPPAAVEVNLADVEDVDVVIVQRPEELDRLPERLRGVAKIYVEHNTPRGDVPNTRHPMADRDDVLLVHVTHFNELFWDNGGTRTALVEHGIVEPAVRYGGELGHLAVATNEPVRRGRVTGTDLIPRFTSVAPVDVFGMGVQGLAGNGITTYDDLPQDRMHRELARRRAYLHLCRWTSLGLSLIEAMTIGMPVIVLATTEAVAAVPAGAGVLTTDLDTMVEAARWFVEEPEVARRVGQRARRAAVARYGLDRFLADWDKLLEAEFCASR